MENQNLRKRLYQNLSQRPLKHTFLLETQMKDPKSSSGILRPKILQESIGQLKNLSNSFVANQSLLKSPQLSDKKQKPQKVEVQKLSKQAKTLIEDGKNKIKSNLKPVQIFAFYDAFPEMIEDFFYLNRMSHPYDYQIVSYAKRNSKEYMTISSQGVTLYHDKEAEFLTRDQWLEDEKIYYQLQKIDFFSQYKLSKNFMIWKNKMKRHYMRSMSNILREKLFLTTLHPRNCLISVRGFCIELQQNLNLLPSEHIQILNWKQLIDNTNLYLSSTLTKKISEHENKIVNCLELAIDEQIKNFKQNNKIKIDGLNNQEENKEGYIYSQEAILRKQYKRVLKLIKLAEGLLLESKIRLIKRWMMEILEKLQDIKESNFRDQWLTINFVAMPPGENSNEITWNPSAENFLNIFKDIIDKAIEQICKKHDKIMNHPTFQKYRNSDDQSFSKDDKHNFLKNLIEESDFYPELIRKIQKNLKQEFEHVTAQDKDLKKYVQIYKKHKSMPPLDEIIKESTAGEIAIYVHEWKQDNEQMKDLADKCMGMIRFDFSLMRKEMMSVAENSYTKLFALLPNHLSQFCREITDKTEELLRPINEEYREDTFVESTKALKRASENLEAITEQGFEIKRLELLMIENKCPSIDIHRAKLSELAKKIDLLNKTVGEAERQQGTHLNKFKTKNELIVQTIKKGIKEYLEVVQKLQIEQKHLPQDTMTQKISEIEGKIANLDKQATSINNVENQLGLPETDFSQSHNLYKRTRMLSSLWNQKKIWVQFVSQLAKKHYRDLDYEKEMKTWQDFSTELGNIKQVLDQNEHLNELTKQINDLYNEMQLVKALQSKSLNERSWGEISEYLAYEFEKKQVEPNDKARIEPFKDPKDPLYTMEWIKRNRLCLYKERIELIVKNSEKETYLLNVQTTLKTYITNLNLKFVSKKGDLNLLADNTIVFEKLADHLAVLIEIFNHDYSDLLKRETKLLVKHYEYVIQILEAYRDFSVNWEKYEELFDSSKNHSKLLMKESKDFTILETMWKKMSKSIMSPDWSKKVYDEAIGSNPSRNTMKLIHKANSSWQQIKKGVEEYLDRKRNTFHHYYYYSDDELLALLKMFGLNSNINSVVPLIYENIKCINFDPNTDALSSVVSIEEEELKINKVTNYKAVSDFQELLKNCEDIWKKSLITTIKKVFSDFISSNEEQLTREKITLDNVAQVALAFDNIVWVKLAEETYLCPEPVGLLSDWISIQNTQIEELKQLRQRKGLTALQRKKLDLVIVQEVYLRDKTEHFLHTMTRSLDSYEWERTLKLCDGTANTIYLKALNSIVYYGGEFLSLPDSICIAPETERSFLNLAQMIYDREIGVISTTSHSPETIRSFGYLVAQNFRSFTFCHGVSEKVIDRILSGICSQGIWSCLTVPDSWEIVSYLASHIILIEKFIREKENARQNSFSAQISKHSISINQFNLPVFFLAAPAQQFENLRKIPRLNYRLVQLVKPSLKCILSMNLSHLERYEQIVDVVVEITDYCRQLFVDQCYDEFGNQFALKVLDEMKGKANEGDNVRKKAVNSVTKILMHRLKQEGQMLLQEFVQSFNFETQHKMKIKKSTTVDIPLHSNRISGEEMEKYGQRFIKNANNLYEAVNRSWQSNKNLIVVGSQFSGKTFTIHHVKNFMESQSRKKINLKTVYFMAYRDHDLMSANEKGPGIIAKCLKQNYQNWIVLDGPLNSKYLHLFGNISSEAALSNYGVIKNGEDRKKLKILLQTTSLSSLSPDFMHCNEIIYMEEDEKTAEEIIKSSITNFLYGQHEEQVRMETKGDENTQFEVKSLRLKSKQLGLPKELAQLLISQMVSLIQKLTLKGSIKIKSLELLYQISASELAFRCSRLAECIFSQNWDTINEKVTRKSVEKFAIWVVLWSISAIVSPDDYQKLEKAVSEIAKSNLCEDILKSIVFPGSGLEIFSINSERAQNTLFSNYGGISNIVDRYESLFNNDTATIKNKFQPDFYDAEPNKLRVITEEAVIFSYFAMINRQGRLPIALYGPSASGKKSIIDVFNKSNQDSVESFSVRFKKQNPYSIGKQIQKPFNKFNCPHKTLLKPYDISKRIHISIDDVSMTPYHEPSTEFLRMLADTNSLYDDKFNLAELRQLMLTITLNQIKFHNFEGVDFKRVLSRFFILQTAKKTKQSLSSIFSVIILNLLNGKFEDSECFLNKSGQNIIINSTVCIYSFVEELLNARNLSHNVEGINRKLMLMPKIMEVCNVVTNICKIQEEGELDLEYYAEVWAHEVLRVFGDKLASPQEEQALFDEVKKYSFMEFKHNLPNALPSFIFTDFGAETDGRFVYHKYKFAYEIKKQIQDLYCRQSNSDELPFIEDQAIIDIVRIYRVLQMKGGHLLLATPYKKTAKLLIKIANYMVKSSFYHDLEHGELDFDGNLAPSILKDMGCTVVTDVETVTEEALYQLTCLANRNLCEFQPSPEIREKIKLRLFALAQQGQVKQPQTQQPVCSSLPQKPRSPTQNQLLQTQNRIQFNFLQICIDCLSDYLHIVCLVHPSRAPTTKFLSENTSLTKYMQVSWYEFKSETLSCVGERLALIYPKDSVQLNQEFMGKCMEIYQGLGEEKRSWANFVKYHDNCCRVYQNLVLKVNEQIQQYQECIEVINKNIKQIQEQKGNSKRIKENLEEIVKNKEELGLKMKDLQESGATEELEELQAKMKQIKIDEKSIDIQSREQRVYETMCETFSNLLPRRSELESKVKQFEQIIAKGQEYSILVETAILYLNNATKKEYMAQFNAWLKILGEKEVDSVEQILEIFLKVYEIQFMRIPGWHNFSAFTQLKGFHFCENFRQIPDSIFGSEPIVVNDKEEMLVKLLSKISSPSYPNNKLIAYFGNKKEKACKKESSLRGIKAQVMTSVEKEIFKAINEQKDEPRADDRYELKKGIIIIGQNQKWQPTRNDIDMLQKKMQRERRILISNHVVIRGQTCPNITIHPDNDDLRCILLQKSMQLEYGESLVNENNRFEILIRQHNIIEEQKNQTLVQRSIAKESQEQVLKKIEITQKELALFKNEKSKMMQYLMEERRQALDVFLIDWLLGYQNQSSAWTFQRVIEVYEFLKKCLMELNMGREDKIKDISEIDPSIVQNWQNLIKVNLTESEQRSLQELIKFSMPLEQTSNLILIAQDANTETQIQSIVAQCSFHAHFIDTHGGQSKESPATEHEGKSLWVFNKLVAGNSQHLTFFFDYFEKNRQHSSPVVIVIADNVDELARNQQMRLMFRVRKNYLSGNLISVYHELSCIENEHREKKNVFQPSKTSKKGFQEEQEGQPSVLGDKNNQQEVLKLKQLITKFLTILIGVKMSKDSHYSSRLPLKAIASRVQLVRTLEQAKVFLNDMLMDLTKEWSDLLNDVLSTADTEKMNEIEALYIEYRELLEIPAGSQGKGLASVKESSLSFAKQEEIQEILNELPFGFNNQDFKQTTQPLTLWLISQANRINDKRFFFKKYLQDCLKISKGDKLNYWTNKSQFGFPLPTPQQINKLYNNYKITKKALEMVGQMSGIDASSKQIKLLLPSNNANGQGQSMQSITAQAFDFKSFDAFSQKLIVLLMIKASKKLKLPLYKLRKSWRFVMMDTSISEQVYGEHCLTVNVQPINVGLFSPQIIGNSNENGGARLLMMIFDPSQSSAPIQQISKQPKKQKIKKQKTQVKSLHIESNNSTIEIPIVLRNQREIGSIRIPVDETVSKFKSVTCKPSFGIL